MKRFLPVLLFLGCLGLLPATSQAQITYVATVAGVTNPTTPATAFTIPSVVVSAGSNRALVVTAASRTSAGCGITGVTFNTSENFTVGKAFDPGGDFCVEAWTLANPTATTANVVITFAATQSEVGAAAITLNGVKQSSYLDATQGLNCTCASVDFSSSKLTTTTSGDAVIDITASGTTATPTMTAETNRTQRMAYSGTALKAFTSTLVTKAPAGDVLDQWTGIGGNGVSLAGISLKPAVTVTRHRSIPTAVGP